MTLQDRISAFVALGKELQKLTPDHTEDLVLRARNINPWFDERNVTHALNGIIYLLDKLNLEDWLFVYKPDKTEPKKVGVVMAGNTPVAGFHDFMCVLLAGHYLVAKLSSDDNYLLKYLADRLIKTEPQFTPYIQFAENLKEVDAIIATSSDNTSRYFEYYFAKKPHIIRKNRTSLGLLTGKETKEELQALGNDIFQYYGLSSRNVSKVLVPEGYTFNQFYEALEPFQYMPEHNKYQNNYDYNKSILLVNRVPHFDNGFLLVQESDQLVSPISVLFYQTYSDLGNLKEQLAEVADKTQVVLSAGAWYPNSLAFGQGQCPAPWEYADGIDTMAFLSSL